MLGWSLTNGDASRRLSRRLTAPGPVDLISLDATRLLGLATSTDVIVPQSVVSR
jgi:hypothetical protein